MKTGTASDKTGTVHEACDAEDENLPPLLRSSVMTRCGVRLYRTTLDAAARTVTCASCEAAAGR